MENADTPTSGSIMPEVQENIHAANGVQETSTSILQVPDEINDGHGVQESSTLIPQSDYVTLHLRDELNNSIPNYIDVVSESGYTNGYTNNSPMTDAKIVPSGNRNYHRISDRLPVIGLFHKILPSSQPQHESTATYLPVGSSLDQTAKLCVSGH